MEAYFSNSIHTKQFMQNIGGRKNILQANIPRKKSLGIKELKK